VAGDREPALRAAILDDSFERFTCEGCQRRFHADHRFLYIDFTRGHWIDVWPTGEERRWREIEPISETSWRTNMSRNAPPLVRRLSADFVPRVVFGLRALRDKLCCLDAALSDRMLEVLKLDIMRSQPNLPFGPLARPSLFQASDDTLHFEILQRVPDDSLIRSVLTVTRSRLLDIATDPLRWTTPLTAVSGTMYVDLGRLFY